MIASYVFLCMLFVTSYALCKNDKVSALRFQQTIPTQSMERETVILKDTLNFPVHVWCGIGIRNLGRQSFFKIIMISCQRYSKEQKNVDMPVIIFIGDFLRFQELD